MLGFAASVSGSTPVQPSTYLTFVTNTSAIIWYGKQVVAERACTHSHSTDTSLCGTHHICALSADVLSLHCTLSPHAQGSSSVVPHHLYRYQLHCMLSRRQYVWHECRLTLSKHCLHHCACHHHHQAGLCSVNLTLLLVCRFRQMAAVCIVLAVVMNVYAMDERSQFNTCFQVGEFSLPTRS